MRKKVNSAGYAACQHESDVSRTEVVERREVEGKKKKRKEKASIKHLGMHQPNTTLQVQDDKKKKTKKRHKTQENANHQEGKVSPLVGKHATARGPNRHWALRKGRAWVAVSILAKSATSGWAVLHLG